MINRWLAILTGAAHSVSARLKAAPETLGSWLQTMRHLGDALKEFWRAGSSAFRERRAQRRPAGLLAIEPPKPEPVADPVLEPVLKPVFQPEPEPFFAARAPAETEPRRRWRPLRLAAGAIACVAIAPFLLILVYRYIDPPVSALMMYQTVSGTKVSHQWRSLDEISPELMVAVLVSEDAQFCKHWGVDWKAVSEAWGDAEDGGKLRGASTIPMQTAKNLFFWPGRSYMRKIAEAPLAYFMSAVWPKDRVMEVYLNIVEWGPGVFGAEAAAQYHFRKPASRLNAYEAAALAASLPNPIERHAGRPGPQTYRLIGRLRKRVAAERRHAQCVIARSGGASSIAVAGAPAQNRKPDAPRQDRPKQDSASKDPFAQEPFAKEPFTKDPWSRQPSGEQQASGQDRRPSSGENWDPRQPGRDGWDDQPSRDDRRGRDRWASDPWDREPDRGAQNRESQSRGGDDRRSQDTQSRDWPSDRSRDWFPGDPYGSDYNSGQSWR